MSYHEPTMEEIRHTYICMFIPVAQAERGQAFDAWLAEHDRQVAERVWDEGWNASERFGYPVDGPDAETYKNPYRKDAHP